MNNYSPNKGWRGTDIHNQRQQEIAALYERGMTQAEIADILDISQPTVCRALQLRAKLRDNLRRWPTRRRMPTIDPAALDNMDPKRIVAVL